MNRAIKFIFLRFWNLLTHTNLNLHLFFNRNKYKKFNKKLNIIFVKPSNYLDIYYKNFSKNFKLILESNFRIGPVGLFTEHNSKFVISSSYNGKKINFKKNSKNLNKSRLKQFRVQYLNRKNIYNINFSKYDIGISFKDTIPKEIILKYPKVLWLKMFEDHKNKNFKKNIIFKPSFFDGVLNQTLGFTPYSFFRKKHFIDFPYTFGNSYFLKKINKKLKKNIDVILEVNQTEKIKMELSQKIKKNNLKKEKIFFLDETLNHKDYITKISKGLFFIAINSNTPRWGNSLIEAALCENLIIGNRNFFWNSQLIINELDCKDVKSALKLVIMLKKNKNLYKKYLDKQNLLLNYLNYHRPLSQIVDCSNNCNRYLNILKKI